MPKRISIDSKEPDEATGSPAPSGPVIVKPENKEKKPEPELSELNRELESKSSHSSISAFCAFPTGVKFAGERSDEEIVLLMRAHVVTNVPWLAITLGLILAPVILLPLLSSIGVLPDFSGGLATVLFLFWYLGALTYAFLNFLSWYFNAYIVTNKRLVDIDWYSIVHKEVSYADLDKVQDITPIQVGVIAGLFDFGTVNVQTAGTVPYIEFDNVPHPTLVVRKIQELVAEATK